MSTLVVGVLFGAAVVSAAKPNLSPKCEQALEAYCEKNCAEIIDKSHCNAEDGRPVVAAFAGPGANKWRCYAPGDLQDNTTYTKGICYCSRDTEIRQVLTKCGGPVPPPPLPPPGPPAPSLPEPSIPNIPSKLPSSVVFYRGQTASDGTVYPCVRIPSIINAKGVLLAFSECRLHTGDGCELKNFSDASRRDICMRRSTDSGATWGNLTVIYKDAGQDTAVYDGVSGNVIIQVDGVAGVGQLVSPDLGLTWSTFSSVSGIEQSSVGPGVGIQLSPKNPHAAGRLLFIGHAGAYIQDYVWYSDDHGKTYKMSTTSTGKSLLHMDEAQLVELENGVVMANMRNNLKGRERGVAVSHDGGATFGPIVFDQGLPTPVCMGSIIRAEPPYGDGSVFFANPGSTAGRVNGVVRRSQNCTGLPPDACAWGDHSFEVSPGHGYAYSCLVPVNTTHVGLLWETNTTLCTGPSCMQVFTTIPISQI